MRRARTPHTLPPPGPQSCRRKGPRRELLPQARPWCWLPPRTWMSQAPARGWSMVRGGRPMADADTNNATPGGPGRTPDSSRRSREDRLDEMADHLATAVDALVSDDDWRAAIAFAARFRSRSFANNLLIGLQHNRNHASGLVPEAVPSYVAGYRQWQQLGRQVTKGQPGMVIRAPVTRRYATRDVTDLASWRRLDKREKPRPGETVRHRMIGVRPAYVWDVSQTSGEAIPERPRPQLLRGQAPDGLVDAVRAAIGRAGFTVANVPDRASLGGANGRTRFDNRTVQVRADMDEAAVLKTLLHEYGHVLLHEPDTDRGADAKRLTLRERRIGEVEAESVAMMVASCYGVDTSDYTVPYVASWAEGDDLVHPAEIVRRTGERVRTASLSILAELPEPPVDDGLPAGLSGPPVATLGPSPDNALPTQPGIEPDSNDNIRRQPPHHSQERGL